MGNGAAGEPVEDWKILPSGNDFPLFTSSASGRQNNQRWRNGLSTKCKSVKQSKCRGWEECFEVLERSCGFPQCKGPIYNVNNSTMRDWYGSCYAAPLWGFNHQSTNMMMVYTVYTVYFNVETTQIQLVFLKLIFGFCLRISLTWRSITFCLFSLNLGPLNCLVLVIIDSFLMAFIVFFCEIALRYCSCFGTKCLKCVISSWMIIIKKKLWILSNHNNNIWL